MKKSHKNCIIVCYDISDNKLRSKFSKFLSCYGVRLQMSVFELEHSVRLLNVIEEQIKKDFEPYFKDCDSIFLFYTDLNRAVRYGASRHLDNGLIILDFTD